jgi:hypothetical protein
VYEAEFHVYLARYLIKLLAIMNLLRQNLSWPIFIALDVTEVEKWLKWPRWIGELRDYSIVSNLL